MNEGIHLDLDTWIVPGQIRKANLCRGLGNRYTLVMMMIKNKRHHLDLALGFKTLGVKKPSQTAVAIRPHYTTGWLASPPIHSLVDPSSTTSTACQAHSQAGSQARI